MPYMGITLATIFTMLRLANEAKMRQVICAGTSGCRTRGGASTYSQTCAQAAALCGLCGLRGRGGGDRLRLRGRKSSSRLGLAGSVVKHVWRMLEEGAGILAHGDKAQVSTPDMARAGLPRCFHRVPSPRVQVATCFHGPQARDT